MSLPSVHCSVGLLAAASLFLAACQQTAPSAPATTAPAPTTAAAPPTPAAAAASPAAAQPAASPAASPAAKPAAAASPSPAAAASPAVQPAAAAPGGTSQPLTIASLANLSKTLHPYPDNASFTQSWEDAANLIWATDGGGGLLEFDWDKLEYGPAIAREMPRISPDGKTYTLTLRDDVKWSDGSTVTADDFTFAWDNASKKENDYVGLDNLEEIASYRAPDKNTIEVVLNETKPRDVALGIVNTIVPVPKKVWEGKPWNDPTANPEILNPSVVLGPYKVQEFRVAERAVFTAINTYYKGSPRIPRIEFAPGQQPTVAYETLKAGRAQWAPNIPPAQYEEAKANPELTMYEWTAANASYRVVEFNTKRPFLSDKRVREALARAISRDDVLQVAELGLATPQYSFITPTNTKWVNNNVEKYDFDVNKAKQLLQDAGYQNQGGRLVGRDGQPVSLEILYPTSSAPRGKIATYMQQQYRDLGIEVEVRGLDFNAYTDQVGKQKNFDISLGTYGGGSLDPDQGPKPQVITTGQQNVTGYSNPQVDDLFRQAANELDDVKRKQMYDQAQQIVTADIPAFYVYALESFSPASKKLQGITPTKGNRLDYNDQFMRWSVAQ
jgi:peptide/nickel transport system substrate-binding protein